MENNVTYVFNKGNDNLARRRIGKDNYEYQKKDDIINTIFDAYKDGNLKKGISMNTNTFFIFSFKTKNNKKLQVKIRNLDAYLNRNYINNLSLVCSEFNRVKTINRIKIAACTVLGSIVLVTATPVLFNGAKALLNIANENDNMKFNADFEEWQNDPHYQKAIQASENYKNDLPNILMEDGSYGYTEAFDEEGKFIDYDDEITDYNKIR